MVIASAHIAVAVAVRDTNEIRIIFATELRAVAAGLVIARCWFQIGTTAAAAVASETIHNFMDFNLIQS